MVALISTGSLFAQVQQNPAQQDTDVSDEELKQFAAALQEVQNISQEGQEKMVATLEEEGMGVQKYNEIAQSQQNPEQEVNATAEEMKTFETVNEEIAIIQTNLQKKMETKIEEKGLTVQRYQEIAGIVQNDPTLQQKVQEFLQG